MGAFDEILGLGQGGNDGRPSLSPVVMGLLAIFAARAVKDRLDNRAASQAGSGGAPQEQGGLGDMLGGLFGGGAAAGGLGGMLGGLFGGGQGQPAPGAAPPTGGALSQVGGPGGFLNNGLGGLLESFGQAGHGEAANSWVGTGENRSVSPDQIRQSIDPQTLSQLAKASGLSEDEIVERLTHELPGTVDRLTPGGSVPSAGA